MATRPTSIWVPIERLLAHPDNANAMTPEVREKLRENIDATGHYPPLIVRTLELSHRWTQEFKDDKLQIIDGHHRFLDQQERGAKEVEVRVWGGISDNRAVQLLLTMNNLRGKDDPKKRNAMIRVLGEIEPDADVLSRILPEDADTIQKIISETTREAIDNATTRATELGRQEAMTFFVEPEQAEAIRAAIKSYLDINDPDRMISECREGYAMQQICQGYLDE